MCRGANLSIVPALRVFSRLCPSFSFNIPVCLSRGPCGHPSSCTSVHVMCCLPLLFFRYVPVSLSTCLAFSSLPSIHLSFCLCLPVYRSTCCRVLQILQEERVLRKVDVGEYPLDLVPLDKDVLSLELDGLFRRVSRAKRTENTKHVSVCVYV